MSVENQETGTEEQTNPVSAHRKVAYYYDRILNVHCIKISEYRKLFIWEASSHESVFLNLW